jgi:serine/threonine protein kinase/Tol biopolymer transport system component
MVARRQTTRRRAHGEEHGHLADAELPLSANIKPGTRLGRYEIKSPLGVGGMGEVYLAMDAELNRLVALKFLPAGVASDERRMTRFVQEARAASALNHPNIITIYDIGQTEDGTRFFATEFIDGETLRERLNRGGMKLGEVLDVASQIASALVAAHAAGIVHRDIKPENVMLRHDGYVKVLDFGLAKLAGNPASSVDTEAATRALAVTDPGSVMGTVAYMSPEQAAGKDVDARTDIWSLGVVLYEMLTGRTPFAGRSSSHTIVAILDEEPPPLARFVADAPEALQELVADALTKDREARFQTSKQMLAKLRRLKGRLDAGTSLDHSIAPNLITRASHDAADFTASLDSQTRTGATATPQTTAHTGGVAAATQASGAVVAERPWGHRRARTVAWTAVVFAAICGLAFGVYRYASRSQTGSLPFAQLQNMKFTKLPAVGVTLHAVISPDGKLVARVAYEAGKSSLRLRQVATPNEKEIVAPSDDNYVGVIFSRDGEFLYYVKGKSGQFFHELFRVSVLGGEPQKVVFDIDSVPSLSPDGKRLAFVRRMPKTDEDTLVLANADGGGEQVIATRQRPSVMESPAWSPDGRTVAFTINGRDDAGYFVHVEEVNVADRSSRVISGERWRSIGGVAWLPDGSGLIINARDRASLPGTPLQIWHVGYPEGSSRRVTNDLNYYNTLSLTADARTLLAVENEGGVFNLWLAPNGDAARARQLTADGTGDQPAWTPDGRLVYYSQASGNGDIWVMNADGGGRRQLTTDENNDSCPSVSPDGRFIAFVSNRGVGWGVWRMNADGSDAKELMRNVDQGDVPQWSPDSRFVFYCTRDQNGRLAFWKVSADGGEPAKVADSIDGYTSLAPDGKTFFTLHRDAEPNSPLKIFIRPTDGGAPLRTLDAPDAMQSVTWSPDVQAIDYVTTTAGVSNLWRLPLSGGKARQLTDWKSDRIGWFAWSADGKQLALSRGTNASDIVLIRDFR